MQWKYVPAPRWTNELASNEKIKYDLKGEHGELKRFEMVL